MQVTIFKHILCCFFSVPHLYISQPQSHLKPSTEVRAARRRIDTAAAERAVRTCIIMVAYDLCLRALTILAAVWRSDVS